jgi:hypothetical protein
LLLRGHVVYEKKRREDRHKTHPDGCETAEDVGVAGAVVGHKKLEERERERSRAVLERDFFLG